MPEAPNRYWLL